MDICTLMLTAALITIGRNLNVHQQMNGLTQWVYTMENYSVTKWNKVLIHTVTWMNLKNIMLIKNPDTKGQTLYDLTSEGPGEETGSSLLFVRGWGVRIGVQYSMSVWNGNKVLMMHEDSQTAMWRHAAEPDTEHIFKSSCYVAFTTIKMLIKIE